LHHTNIVPVYSVGCERGVHYYAMQFIDGHTLAAVLAGLRGPGGRPAAGPGADGTAAGGSTRRSAGATAHVRQAACWALQAAEALEHAHQQGVVHRDVKPGNLLVDGRGQLWVTDFGLAHFLAAPAEDGRNLTLSGDLVGTLRYMSPEQALARRGAVDHRTDVYSLGATLYELLTLRPVLPGRDRQELLRRIAREEPRPPRRLNKAVPAELETVVLKALAKEPAERYATAQELADDLRRFLEDRPIRARRPSLPERLRRWSRRHRAVLTASVAVLLVAVVALAAGCVYVWQEKEQTQAEKDAADTARARAVRETRLADEATLEARGEAKRAEDATRRADRATARALQAQRDEKRQRELAEGNLDGALGVLSGFLEQANDSQPRDPQRGLDEQALTRGVLAFYEEFLGRNPDNLKVRRGVLRAHTRIASLQRKLGHFAEARQACARALVLGAGLAKERPDDADLAHARAALHQEMALIRSAQGRTRDAEKAFRQGLALLPRTANDLPAGPAAPRRTTPQVRAQLLGGLGILLRDDRQFAEAEKVLAEARALWDELVRKRGRADDWYGLAHCRNNQGLLLAYTNRPDQAERAHREAEEVFARLAREEVPSGSQYLNDLAAARYNLGNLYIESRPALAEKYYRSAAEARERLVRLYPAAFEYRMKLGWVYGNLAVLLERQGKVAQAQLLQEAALQTKVAAFQASPQHPDNRKGLCVVCLNLARLYARTGKVAEARALYADVLGVARKLAEEFPGEVEYRRLPAMVYQARAEFLAGIGRPAEAAPDYQAALPLWQKLAKDFPGGREFSELEAQDALALGEALLSTGRPGEAGGPLARARVAYGKLAAGSPGSAGYHGGLAAALHLSAAALGQQGMWDQGRPLLREAVGRQKRAARLDPQAPGCAEALRRHYALLAAAALHLGDHAGAARTAEEYEGDFPLHWYDAHRVRGMLLDCVPAAEKDGRLSADDRQAAARRYARKAAAVQAEAVRRCGNSPPAWSQLAWLLATEADARKRDPAGAVALARKVAGAAPENWVAHQVLGVASYRAGDWKGTLAALERSVELAKGGNSVDWFFLAMARWRMGDRGAAGQAYRRGQELLAKFRPVPAQVRAFQAEAAALMEGK
jgi:tetratricopeptide (TPR) repeat protein